MPEGNGFPAPKGVFFMNISMKVVPMIDGSTKIKLETPFHPDLPKRLSALGGGWSDIKRAWYLPADLEKEIRQVCLDIFQIDPMGDQPVDLVNVRIDISSLSLRVNTLWMFGRSVLRRMGRDARVKPGDDISIVAGGFASSGGSRNNPAIGYPEDGTVILVRGVPRASLEKFALEYPDLTAQIDEQLQATPQE